MENEYVTLKKPEMKKKKKKSDMFKKWTTQIVFRLIGRHGRPKNLRKSSERLLQVG